jgi:hypothetical protein
MKGARSFILPVKRYTQALESLLASCIPDLHGYQLIIDHDLFSQEIST